MVETIKFVLYIQRHFLTLFNNLNRRVINKNRKVAKSKQIYVDQAIVLVRRTPLVWLVPA